MKRSALGKGLEALIPPVGSTGEDLKNMDSPGDNNVLQIPIDKIKPNPFQPRSQFDPVKLDELASSIKEQGIIQPVVVRKVDDGYELIAGERRLRAAEKLGHSTISSIVHEFATDEVAIELALIENIQREDLNPIEEAKAYRKLMTQCGLTQADVAVKVGKDRSSVANVLRLLSLPGAIQTMISEGKISAGHARALMAFPTESEKIALAKKIVAQQLSVRQVEKIVYVDQPRKDDRLERNARSAELVSVEETLKRKLGTKVTILMGRKRGRIIIDFYSSDELNRILEAIGAMENL